MDGRKGITHPNRGRQNIFSTLQFNSVCKCLLLKTIANSLDPGQALQHVKPGLSLTL